MADDAKRPDRPLLTKTTPSFAVAISSHYQPVAVWGAVARHTRHIDTLTPGVALIVDGPDGGYVFEMSIELAEQVADQIVEQAKIARANHWQQPDAGPTS